MSCIHALHLRTNFLGSWLDHYDNSRLSLTSDSSELSDEFCLAISELFLGSSNSNLLCEMLKTPFWASLIFLGGVSNWGTGTTDINDLFLAKFCGVRMIDVNCALGLVLRDLNLSQRWESSRRLLGCDPMKWCSRIIIVSGVRAAPVFTMLHGITTQKTFTWISSVLLQVLAWDHCKMWSGRLFWALHYKRQLSDTILLSSKSQERYKNMVKYDIRISQNYFTRSKTDFSYVYRHWFVPSCCKDFSKVMFIQIHSWIAFRPSLTLCELLDLECFEEVPV